MKYWTHRRIRCARSGPQHFMFKTGSDSLNTLVLDICTNTLEPAYKRGSNGCRGLRRKLCTPFLETERTGSSYRTYFRCFGRNVLDGPYLLRALLLILAAPEISVDFFVIVPENPALVMLSCSGILQSFPRTVLYTFCSIHALLCKVCMDLSWIIDVVITDAHAG